MDVPIGGDAHLVDAREVTKVGVPLAGTCTKIADAAGGEVAAMSSEGAYSASLATMTSDPRVIAMEEDHLATLMA